MNEAGKLPHMVGPTNESMLFSYVKS